MVARFHYEDVIYQQLLDDQLRPQEQQDVTQHLEACTQCQSKLETLAEQGIDWSELRKYLKPVLPTLSKEEANKDSIWIGFLEPSEWPDSLGRFGRYEILEVLGRGGTGIVMRGYDPSLDRQSAIKVLSPELAASAAARKRFSREAKSAAAVVHEHVVPIQTVDEEQGIPYLVMPVLEGRSLEERVRQQGPLDVKEVLRIGRQIASGLAAAHAQGLVHRDVKPANILQHTGVERVVITDFGLARAVDDASMTQSGMLVGTPQYMSPEQARGETLDARSDLFSLGSVLYFLCVGHSPFRAETTMGVLSRITGDDPRSLPQQNPDIPEWLDQIIRRLLSKNPEDRYQNAAVVEQLLGKWLAHLQDPTGTPRPSEPPEASAGRGNSRRRNLVLAALGGFALAWAGIFVMLETNKGTLTIQSDSDDVAVRITQGEEVAKQLTVTKGDNQVRLAAGQYVVEIEGEHDGLSIKNGEVTLTRGDEKLVHIVESSTKPVPAGERLFRNIGIGPDGNEIGVPVTSDRSKGLTNSIDKTPLPPGVAELVGRWVSTKEVGTDLQAEKGEEKVRLRSVTFDRSKTMSIQWQTARENDENIQIYVTRFHGHFQVTQHDKEGQFNFIFSGKILLGRSTRPAQDSPQVILRGTFQSKGNQLSITIAEAENPPPALAILPQTWELERDPATLMSGNEKRVRVGEQADSKPPEAGKFLFGISPDREVVGVSSDLFAQKPESIEVEPTSSPDNKPWYEFGVTPSAPVGELEKFQGLWEEISDSVENPNQRNFLQIYSNRFRFHRSTDASDREAKKDIVGALTIGEQTITFSTWGPPPAGQGDSTETLTRQGMFSGRYHLGGDSLLIYPELAQNFPELSSISTKQPWRFRKVAPEGRDENPSIMSSYPADAKLKRVTFDSDYAQMKGRWIEVANSHGFNAASARMLTIENSRYQLQSLASNAQDNGILTFGLYDRTICFTSENAESGTNPDRWFAGKFEFNGEHLIVTIEGADHQSQLTKAGLPETWVFAKLADTPPSELPSPQRVLEQLQGAWKPPLSAPGVKVNGSRHVYLRGVDFEEDRVLLSWTPVDYGKVVDNPTPLLAWADIEIEPTIAEGTSRFVLRGVSPDPAQDGAEIFRWPGALHRQGDRLWITIVEATNPRAELGPLPVMWELHKDPTVPTEVDRLFESERQKYPASGDGTYRAGEALPLPRKMMQGQWTAVSDMGDELKGFNDPLASVRIVVTGREIRYQVVEPSQNVVYATWGEMNDRGEIDQEWPGTGGPNDFDFGKLQFNFQSDSSGLTFNVNSKELKEFRSMKLPATWIFKKGVLVRDTTAEGNIAVADAGGLTGKCYFFSRKKDQTYFTYSPATFTWQQYQFPAGMKVESMSSIDESKTSGVFGVTGFSLSGAPVSELVAIDMNGKFCTYPLPKPITQEVRRWSGQGGTLYHLVEHKLYAFSGVTGTWDVLDVPHLEEPTRDGSGEWKLPDYRAGFDPNGWDGIEVAFDDHRQLFTPERGKWERLPLKPKEDMSGGVFGGADPSLPIIGTPRPADSDRKWILRDNKLVPVFPQAGSVLPQVPVTSPAPDAVGPSSDTGPSSSGADPSLPIISTAPSADSDRKWMLTDNKLVPVFPQAGSVIPQVPVTSPAPDAVGPSSDTGPRDSLPADAVEAPFPAIEPLLGQWSSVDDLPTDTSHSDSTVMHRRVSFHKFNSKPLEMVVEYTSNYEYLNTSLRVQRNVTISPDQTPPGISMTLYHGNIIRSQLEGTYEVDEEHLTITWLRGGSAPDIVSEIPSVWKLRRGKRIPQAGKPGKFLFAEEAGRNDDYQFFKVRNENAFATYSFQDGSWDFHRFPADLKIDHTTPGLTLDTETNSLIHRKVTTGFHQYGDNIESLVAIDTKGKFHTFPLERPFTGQIVALENRQSPIIYFQVNGTNHAFSGVAKRWDSIESPNWPATLMQTNVVVGDLRIPYPKGKHFFNELIGKWELAWSEAGTKEDSASKTKDTAIDPKVEELLGYWTAHGRTAPSIPSKNSNDGVLQIIFDREVTLDENNQRVEGELTSRAQAIHLWQKVDQVLPSHVTLLGDNNQKRMQLVLGSATLEGSYKIEDNEMTITWEEGTDASDFVSEFPTEWTLHRGVPIPSLDEPGRYIYAQPIRNPSPTLFDFYEVVGEPTFYTFSKVDQTWDHHRFPETLKSVSPQISADTSGGYTAQLYGFMQEGDAIKSLVALDTQGKFHECPLEKPVSGIIPCIRGGTSPVMFCLANERLYAFSGRTGTWDSIATPQWPGGTGSNGGTYVPSLDQGFDPATIDGLVVQMHNGIHVFSASDGAWKTVDVYPQSSAEASSLETKPAASNLSISASADGISLFRVRMVNTSKTTLRNVKVEETIDPNLRVIARTTPAKDFDGKVVWKLPVIPGGAEAILEVQCQAIKNITQATNTLKVTGDGIAEQTVSIHGRVEEEEPAEETDKQKPAGDPQASIRDQLEGTWLSERGKKNFTLQLDSGKFILKSDPEKEAPEVYFGQYRLDADNRLSLEEQFSMTDFNLSGKGPRRILLSAIIDKKRLDQDRLSLSHAEIPGESSLFNNLTEILSSTNSYRDGYFPDLQFAKTQSAESPSSASPPAPPTASVIPIDGFWKFTSAEQSPTNDTNQENLFVPREIRINRKSCSVSELEFPPKDLQRSELRRYIHGPWKLTPDEWSPSKTRGTFEWTCTDKPYQIPWDLQSEFSASEDLVVLPEHLIQLEPKLKGTYQLKGNQLTLKIQEAYAPPAFLSKLPVTWTFQGPPEKLPQAVTLH